MEKLIVLFTSNFTKVFVRKCYLKYEINVFQSYIASGIEVDHDSLSTSQATFILKSDCEETIEAVLWSLKSEKREQPATAKIFWGSEIIRSIWKR